MLILKSDNRVITTNAKYSFLVTNHSSSSLSFAVTNTDGFSVDDFLLVGNWGSETAEILKAKRIDSVGNIYLNAKFGDSTTQWNIQTWVGDQVSYQWNATGTDPQVAGNIHIGDTIYINVPNFSSVNNGTFTVSNVVGGAFYVTNASGLSESGKAIGTGIISLANNKTRFAHPESTKVTILPYNQVEFFYELTSTFIGAISLTGKINLSPSDFFTTYSDPNNSTGYGFFRLSNSQTLATSQPSNAIPYSGFNYNTVKNLIDAFYSLLNNKELKLITNQEALLWMNEGYSVMYNQLNLINNDYDASLEITLDIISGIKEYQLLDDFSDLISIVDAQRLPIEFIKLEDAASYTLSVPKYYIRNKYIGFAPTPTSDSVVYYRYLTRAGKLDSYDDVINLPNDAYYLLKDYMIFRAYQKLKYPNSSEYYKMFTNSVNNMKIDAIKRSANLDSWDIAPFANV